MNRLNVFLVASPQEALAMKRIKEQQQVDFCFAVCYRGYTDSAYYELIKEILGMIGVKFKCIDLYNHRICINENRFLLALKRTILNRQRLSSLIRDLKTRRKEDEAFNFFCQEKSPLLDIPKRCEKDGFYNLDHSPSDGLNRGAGIVINHSDKRQARNNQFWKRAKAIYKTGVLEAVKAATRQVFILSVRIFIRSYCNDNLAGSGYSWRPRAEHQRLSYKDLQLEVRLSKADIGSSKQGSTVLLIDHPAQYKNVDYIRKDLESLDLPRVYADLCKTHCKPEERIVIKKHPYILQNASEQEVRIFVANIKRALSNAGYSQVVELGELVETDIHELLPIEALKECLGVKRFLGFFSSTMILATCWSDVEVISDCRYTRGFRRLRDTERFYMDYDFTEY